MDRLNSMRVLLRVVDEGSFAAAARVLDLSPSVVTRLVADLETHLGVRLLHRSTRRLALTEAGEIYVERIRGIVQDLDDADASVSASTQELAGVLRISVPPALATHLLAPMLAGFRQRYPRIRFDIDVDPLDAPRVEDHDITLLAASVGFDANIIARRIHASHGILVASPEYIARRGTPSRPEELAEHDCLRVRMLGAPLSGWVLTRPDGHEREIEVAINPVIWANHSDTLLRAALDGAGITSSATDLVAPYLESGDLVRVLEPWITGRFTVYAALPSRKFMPRRSRVFLDYLVELIEATPPGESPL